MASYPSNIKTYVPRTDLTDIVLADDVNAIEIEVTAIQTVLGRNPQISTVPVSTTVFQKGTTFPSLLERLANIEAGIVGDNHVHYLKLSTGGTITGNLTVTGTINGVTNIGSQGPAGAQGSQGSIGPQGPQGTSGGGGSCSVGLQGPQGPQGSMGFTGVQGPTGGTGSQGPAGAQGPQGFVGPQGPGPANPVTSVVGRTGDVVIIPNDIGSGTFPGVLVAASNFTVQGNFGIGDGTIQKSSGSPFAFNSSLKPTLGAAGSGPRFIVGDGANILYYGNLVASHREMKRDIVDVPDRTDAVLSLRPVQFHYREDLLHDDEKDALQAGLLIDEVQALGVFEDLLTYGADHEVPVGINYDRIAVLLIPIIKNLREQVADLSRRLA